MLDDKIENGRCWKCMLTYEERRQFCQLCGEQLLSPDRATAKYVDWLGRRTGNVVIDGDEVFVQGMLF